MHSWELFRMLYFDLNTLLQLTFTTESGEQRVVESGMPQELVLGLVVFNLFWNYLELGISSMVAKFVDDTKLWVVKSSMDSEELQNG